MIKNLFCTITFNLPLTLKPATKDLRDHIHLINLYLNNSNRCDLFDVICVAKIIFWIARTKSSLGRQVCSST